MWLKPSGVPHFCGDLPEAEQKLVLATGALPVADLLNQQVPGTAWRTKPSWYIVANNDRTVHTDLERSAAEHMGAANIRPLDVRTAVIGLLIRPPGPPCCSCLHRRSRARVFLRPAGAGVRRPGTTAPASVEAH
ncbi:hypothetical protein SFUMM280S_04325 [Streptomyces fumanus]